MKLKEKEVLLILILSIVIIGSFNFAVFYYLGNIKKILVQFFNLFLSFLILIISFLAFYPKFSIPRKSLFFGTLILFGIIISFIRLPFNEYTPTLIRYLSYFFVATFSFLYVTTIKKERLLKILKMFIYVESTVIIIFGFLEIFLGQLQFINGIYRVSGSFKNHSLGHALFLFMLIILFIELIIRKKINRSLIFLLNIVILSLLIYLFIRSGSRLLTINLLLAYFFYYFFRIKSFNKLIKVLIVSLMLLVVFISLIIHTDISPRLKWVLTSEKKITEEPSTNTRIKIFKNTIDNLKPVDYALGIGSGGFNKFYEKITGQKDIAAHNTYLQILSENGVFGLFLFLTFQLTILIMLITNIRSSNSTIQKIAFLLFIGIDIGAFLENNFYYPFSETIVWLFLGLSMKDKKIDI